MPQIFGQGENAKGWNNALGGIAEGITTFLNGQVMAEKQAQAAQAEMAQKMMLEQAKMQTLMQMDRAKTDYAANVGLQKSMQLEEMKMPTQYVWDNEKGDWVIKKQGGIYGKDEYATETVPKDAKTVAGELESIGAADNVVQTADEIEKMLKEDPSLLGDATSRIQKMQEISDRAAASPGVFGALVSTGADTLTKKWQIENPKSALLAEQLGRFTQFMPNLSKNPRVNAAQLKKLEGGFNLAKNSPDIILNNIQEFKKIASDIKKAKLDKKGYRESMKGGKRSPLAVLDKKTEQPTIVYVDDKGEYHDTEEGD